METPYCPRNSEIYGINYEGFITSDFTPSDYYLFRSLQGILEAKPFYNFEEFKTAIEYSFTSKPEQF